MVIFGRLKPKTTIRTTWNTFFQHIDTTHPFTQYWNKRLEFINFGSIVLIAFKPETYLNQITFSHLTCSFVISLCQAHGICSEKKKNEKKKQNEAIFHVGIVFALGKTTSYQMADELFLKHQISDNVMRTMDDLSVVFFPTEPLWTDTKPLMIFSGAKRQKKNRPQLIRNVWLISENWNNWKWAPFEPSINGRYNTHTINHIWFSFTMLHTKCLNCMPTW